MEQAQADGDLSHMLQQESEEMVLDRNLGEHCSKTGRMIWSRLALPIRLFILFHSVQTDCDDTTNTNCAIDIYS